MTLSSKRRLTAAAAIALVSATSVVATAQAQDDPNATVEEQATTSDLDTDITPVAKETDLWALVHGAKFRETEVIDGSATSFDTDLFDVAFRNRTLGLAGGSTCLSEPVQARGESREEFGRRVAECEQADGTDVPRVPTLYRYHEPADDDPRWDRLTLPGSPTPGYVGSIAWIDANRALIVGGTGTYPRRESNADGKEPTDPAKADPAGEARAWLYHRASPSAPERVEELDLSRFTPDETNRAGMRGFSAVACYQDPLPGKKIELCFAGGLGQMWEWRDGAFNGDRIDTASPEADLDRADEFRYRVREIKFPEIPPAGNNHPPIAAAVTAGCCSVNPDENSPRVLIYHEKPWIGGSGNDPFGSSSMETGPPRWFVREIAPRGADLEALAADSSSGAPSTNARPELPDSFYSLSVLAHRDSPDTGTGEHFKLSAIASPGGADSAGERPSVITTAKVADTAGATDPNFGGTMPFILIGCSYVSAIHPQCNAARQHPPLTTDPPVEASRAQLSTTRLVAGAGDVRSTYQYRPSGVRHPIPVGGGGPTGPAPQVPDGVPDWAAGELRSTRLGALGARGVVVATASAPSISESYARSNGLQCVLGNVCAPTPEEVAAGEYEPIDQAKLDAHRRSQHYLLPSYSLNSVEIVGAEEDGWMVGDHGAILRLSTKAVQAAEAASEPVPPRLGAPRPERLSDRAAYGERELPSEVGAVPAFGGELTELDEPAVVPSGTAGANVEQVVMSRDGSEGWAIGYENGPTFSHYDGTTWRACDPVGVEGVSPPDPACEAMAPLRGYDAGNGIRETVQLTHAARVPLENDSDPTNDDELEIVAIAGGAGAKYKGPETGGRSIRPVVRYRAGRWQFEDPESLRGLDTISLLASAVIGMAFTDRDHGWLAADVGGNLRLFRFADDMWTECVDPAPCGDPGGARLPKRSEGVKGFTAVGERVYLYGVRPVGGGTTCTPGLRCQGSPLILYLDRGGRWTDGFEHGGDKGGFDPAFADPGTTQSGTVESLSVVRRADGVYEGWAVGTFGSGPTIVAPPEAALMRLDPGQGWRRFRSPGAFADHMRSQGQTNGNLQASYPSALEPNGAFIGQRDHGTDGNRIFGFNARRGRFDLLDSGRPSGAPELQLLGRAHPKGPLQAMAPDGQGGFWAAIDGQMLHYTKHAPKPLFEEVANPFSARERVLRDLAAGPDGSVWAATDSGALYRYDRTTGWEEARIPGWDPGRVVTRPSVANAIALGPGGEGLVVGQAGRIASVSGAQVRLDPAAGRSCSLGDVSPCSTSRDLKAVAIAPDSSAFAAGQRLSLVWRPSGGQFQAVDKPAIASATEITGVSYPTPSTAYLATDRGVIFRGVMGAPGEWRWQVDNATPDNDKLLSIDTAGKPIPLRDVAVDAAGRGYAIGDRGLVMRRGPSGWSRLHAGQPEDLTTLALAPDGGDRALIAGERGLVLSALADEIRIARPAEFRGSDAVGAAYLPGSTPGSVDAWVGIGTGSGAAGDSRLLRYRSDPADPLLAPEDASSALPDAPEAQPGELAIGAFGKSDCDRPRANLCPEFSATTTTNELINERIVDELVERREGGGLDLAVLSGDATDSAGRQGEDLVLSAAQLADVPPKHARYEELVADELEEKGVPFLGAIGGQDLAETYACETNGRCETTKRFANAGENHAWRDAFSGHREPWGDGSDSLGEETEGAIAFEAAPGSEDNSLRIENQSADADGDEGPAPEATAEIGGANTHYAVDAVKDGEAIARIVFVDTSLRSLQTSDPLQQPHELAGGQQRFLERMICTEGGQGTFGDGCTREADQKAIVVSNTPAYSYGPGALTHTALDGTTFEATMLRYDVDLVISGALGYNGLYYTLAPGVHEPCPGGAYPQAPPAGNAPDCLAGPTGPTDEVTKRAPADPASLISEQGLSGAYPTLIASGAGGKFGPDGTGAPDGPAGQWHGYSVARLLPDGDIVVEQRPILDWIGMDAPDRGVPPRGRLKLDGYGRSPISTAAEAMPGVFGQGLYAFHYSIDTPAITHSYDLLLADPEEPWLPCEESDIGCQELHANLARPTAEAEATLTVTGEENPCSPHLCLPSRIGVVDDQSGQVRAGDGKYPETFAIAMLSVGDEVATYPLVFKRAPAFVTQPALRAAPAIDRAGTRPSAPPPPPPPPGLPQIPQVEIPQIPPPPGIPQLTAATPPELQPPAPPAPPPPSQQPTPLDLSVAPPGVSISTPTALIQPPTPPVNPAPPGGARREARQRQAAAQKGGADSSEGADETQGSGGDMASSPNETGTAMTRREVPAPARQDYSFTRLESRDPGVPGLPIIAGLTLAAFAAAAGFTTLRPGPRRRPPEVPSPAWARGGLRRGT